MKQKKHYLIGFLVIAGALVYLLGSTFQSSLQYYVTVGELMADEGKYQNKILKVAGKAHDIEQTEEAGKLAYHFNVVEGEKTMPVKYRGMVPDTFKEGSDVVVTGSIAANGGFEATEILAKCASKYEARLEEKEDY